MRWIILIAVSLGLSACLNQGPAPDEGGRLTFGQSAAISSAGTQLAFYRAQNGITVPLRHSPALQAAADARATDLARDPNSAVALAARIAQAGYRACYLAEGVDSANVSLTQAMQAWMADPVLGGQLTSANAIEFAYARREATQTVIVARPCP